MSSSGWVGDAPDPLYEVFSEDLPWFVIAHGVAIFSMNDQIMGFQMHASAVQRFQKVWIRRKSSNEQKRYANDLSETQKL